MVETDYRVELYEAVWREWLKQNKARTNIDLQALKSPVLCDGVPDEYESIIRGGHTFLTIGAGLQQGEAEVHEAWTRWYRPEATMEALRRMTHRLGPASPSQETA
jgi:hypothetical protein